MTQPLSPPLDLALYRETLARLDLRAVRLHELQVQCHREVAGNAKINISTDAGFRREDGALLIDARYKLDASNETNALFTIEATFVVALSAPEELPQDFVEVYIANNLNLTVFPYVRELVASLTARIGFAIVDFALRYQPIRENL